MRLILAFMICVLACGNVQAAEPMSTQPHVNPVPEEFGSGSQNYTVPLPPHFPQYLSNGAINLDEAWIQDGGARYYWNTIIVPRQLKMGGAYWIDPALVPPLVIQPRQKAPVRRYRVVRKPKPVTSPAPVDAASRSLRSPAIPLPVEPVPARSSVVPPPFSPSQARGIPEGGIRTPITNEETSPVQPPRLQ